MVSTCASFGSTLAKIPSEVEGFLRVNSTCAQVQGADRDFAIARGRREIEALDDLKLGIGIAWFDEDKLVAKKSPARFGADELGLFESLHPLEIGGNEDIGGRALLDLFCKGSGGRVSDRCGLAGIDLPCRRDRVERCLQAGGRKDDNRCFRPRAWVRPRVSRLARQRAKARPPQKPRRAPRRRAGAVPPRFSYCTPL